MIRSNCTSTAECHSDLYIRLWISTVHLKMYIETWTYGGRPNWALDVRRYFGHPTDICGCLGKAAL